MFINYNGKFFDKNVPIIQAGNRSLRYGDGLFETILCLNSTPTLLDDHLSRLWNGLKLLEFEIPKLFNPDFLEKEIISLIKKNKLVHARIRLSIFRGNGGLYDPENLYPNFLIESFPIENPQFNLNSNGLHCGIYRNCNKMADQFSPLKHNNFLPYVLAALFAKKQKWNDAILLNQFGNICDSTIANVFIIKNDVVYTPAISDGCVAGVMRNVVIQTLHQSSYQVIESSISPEFMLNADEVFLTNSIKIMQWISSIDSKEYGCDQTIKIFDLLKQTNPGLFC